MRAALVQMTASDAPADNLAAALRLIGDAVAGGAGFVLTPEVTNCLSTSRTRQRAVLCRETEDPVLAGLREAAARHGIWLLAGSLALKPDGPDGGGPDGGNGGSERFVNRSLLIAPAGDIVARYDKIHMFDVEISQTESYRESDGYSPGSRAVLADTPFGRIGLTICYDLRFAHLYRALAQAGAEILTVPSAFSPVTGAAHWEPLLRARAIETGAYVLAPAQTGRHPATRGAPRQTWGHALAVSPWGKVLADAGTAPGVAFVDLDRDMVAEARRRVPSLSHDRAFDGP